jgi:hypothetical protein
MDDLLILGALLVLIIAGVVISRRSRAAKRSTLEESGVPTLKFAPRPGRSRLDGRS